MPDRQPPDPTAGHHAALIATYGAGAVAVATPPPAANGAGWVKTGRKGKPTTITANYFELISRSDFNLLKYRVNFSPEVDHISVCKSLIRVHAALYRGILFYTNRPCPEELFSYRTSNGVPVRITFNLIREVNKKDHAFDNVINIIFKKCFHLLKLTRLGMLRIILESHFVTDCYLENFCHNNKRPIDYTRH